MYVRIFCASMYVDHVHAGYLQKSEERDGSFLTGTGVKGGYEPLWRC